MTTLTTSQRGQQFHLGGILFYTKENNKYRIRNKNTLVTNPLKSKILKKIIKLTKKNINPWHNYYTYLFHSHVDSGIYFKSPR